MADGTPAERPLPDDEVLLGAPRTLRRREVSSAAGVSLLSARKFWRALGFPIVDDEDQAFTEQDVAALRTVTGLVRDGLMDEPTALGMTRAVGRSVDRLATWQVQLLAEYVQSLDELSAPAATPDRAAARRTAQLFTEIADQLEPLVAYAWRRQAASALARILADSESEVDLAADPALPGGPHVDGVAGAVHDVRDGQDHDHDVAATVRSVGFADLVSFTRVVRRLTERELAAMVQRFEAVASDVVTAHGGRVVKTVGDEVLFVARPGARAAHIALGVADEIGLDDLLPDVRVGLATGPVVGRLGDVFGTTVNRASRLTALARPGTVLVDVATVHSLADVADVDVRQLRGRSLRGIGHVVPWVLRRR
ncbi:adenylate/guanylate cyclase domain-containing protein [Angustibacter sp. McL0619]|uniref:adenylate/guanylate cyclase domain-containing protein n=1 Tax=Angustibacter sp. McL0619 TaxID=3415676 RepID=UPI003CF4C4C6